MKPKTSRRAARWSDRPQGVERPPVYPVTAPQPREPRQPVEQRGAGPYEASRDITFGYTQDRSILLP